MDSQPRQHTLRWLFIVCVLCTLSCAARTLPLDSPELLRSAMLYQVIEEHPAAPQIPGILGPQDLAEQQARANLTLLLYPQICLNGMRFTYNFTTKKADFVVVKEPEIPVNYLVETPRLHDLIRVTARAYIPQKTARSYAQLTFEKLRVSLREEKILDDPAALILRAFRLAYIRSIEIFAEKTYGPNIPRILSGYINVGGVPDMREGDQNITLDLLVSVAFEK